MNSVLRRSRLALLLATGLFLSAVSLAQEAEIQAWIDEQVDAGKVLAASAAYLQDGEVSYVFGGASSPDNGEPIDVDTHFQIGSITKVFTNLLLAEMAADGKVAYDTTIGGILGDDLAYANPAVADITLMQLATHSSGLPRLPVNLVPTDPLDPYRGYDEKMLLAGLAASRDRQPLGDHYAYSNYGVGLLGYLLGRVHGDGYQQALSEYVLKPLRLADTGFTANNGAAGYRGGVVVPDWGLDILDGAGSLWSTAGDMMRFARVQLGAIDNPLAHALADDQAVIENGPEGFRLTRVWHVADSEPGTIFWHNGGTGGFWSFFGFRPATDEAIVLLVSGDPDPTGFGLKLLDREPYEVLVTDYEDAILGQYALTPDVGIGIYMIDNTLVGQVSGQTPLAIEAIGDDWYAIGAVDASVRFIRDDDAVVALELAQNGVIQRAEKVAETAATLAKEAIDVSREKLQDYVGAYPINEAAKFTIRLGEVGLEAQITGQPYLPIFAKGDDVFFYKVVDAELHFERDESGNVDALVLRQGGIVQRAEKTQ